MVELNECLSVIIDPSHERYAQAGQLCIDQELNSQSGDLLIRYSDGFEEPINNGEIAGLPQYYLIPKNEARQAERLMSILPRLRERLSEIFDRANNSANDNPTREAQAASAAAAYLIAAELHPELYGQKHLPRDEKSWSLIEKLII